MAFEPYLGLSNTQYLEISYFYNNKNNNKEQRALTEPDQPHHIHHPQLVAIQHIKPHLACWDISMGLHNQNMHIKWLDGDLHRESTQELSFELKNKDKESVVVTTWQTTHACPWSNVQAFPTTCSSHVNDRQEGQCLPSYFDWERVP